MSGMARYPPVRSIYLNLLGKFKCVEPAKASGDMITSPLALL
jgi:hypothetical protein